MSNGVRPIRLRLQDAVEDVMGSKDAWGTLADTIGVNRLVFRNWYYHNEPMGKVPFARIKSWLFDYEGRVKPNPHAPPWDRPVKNPSADKVVSNLTVAKGEVLEPGDFIGLDMEGRAVKARPARDLVQEVGRLEEEIKHLEMMLENLKCRLEDQELHILQLKEWRRKIQSQ